MKKSVRKCLSPPGMPLKRTFAAFLCLALLAGCGSGSKSQETAVAADTMAAAAETTAASYNTAQAPAMYDSGYEDWEAYEEAGEDYNGASALTSSGSITPVSSANRKLIRNVSMNVETDAFDDLLKKIQEQVVQMAGYIEQSDISGSSMNNRYTEGSRYAFMTARIPSNQLDQFIALVEKNGNVVYRSESTQDVTLQYSDLESRKKTLSVEQDRIWALLEKADTLEAVIALEERLSEIRYELESMESTLKLYDNQVEYSTVQLSVNEVTPIDFTPTAPETVGQRIQKGFTKNVKGVVNTLTDLFIFLIAASPVWIPIAAIGGVIAYISWKKARKAAKSQETE